MSITLPTFSELYELAKLEIQTKNTQLTDFNEGSVLDVHCGSSAAVANELVYQLGLILKSFYIQTSEGDDLDLRLKDFNLIRKEASSAEGMVTITRSSSTFYETIRADSTFKCSIDGTEFYNEDEIIFDVGTLSNTVTLIAKIPGTIGNILADKIDTVSPRPTSVMTIIHSSFDNGIEEETDDQLRARFYLEISNLARATQPALIAGALRHTGVSGAAIEKIHSGYCVLYIDAGSGIPSADLIAEVQTDIDANWRAAGEKVTVLSAQTNDVSISGTIYVDSDHADEISKTAILESVTENITIFIQNKQMGKPLYKAELVNLVMKISGISNFNLSAPINDIAGQASKIIRAGVINLDITT